MTATFDTAEGGDLPPEEFRGLVHQVADWMADYLEGVGDLPVFPDVQPGDVRAALPAEPPEVGEPLEEALSDFREIVVPGLTHWNHPGFFGYYAITGSAPGILGEMLAAALNVNAMVWRSSPAATELEDVTTDWLRQLLGLPAGFEGVINDTASSSSLYALAAARDMAYPDAHRRGLFGLPAGRVYASDQTHSSIEKAVLTLGFGREGYRAIASDSEFRMKPDALRDAIEQDLAAGIRPVAVVATLGTTSSSSIDPVSEIAAVAREFELWLHVDAAYAGPAAIVPELRPLLAGWELADSIVVNPHKWLFTPVDCSVLYCRRSERLVRAFSIVPEYLTPPAGPADVEGRKPDGLRGLTGASLPVPQALVRSARVRASGHRGAFACARRDGDRVRSLGRCGSGLDTGSSDATGHRRLRVHAERERAATGRCHQPANHRACESLRGSLPHAHSTRWPGRAQALDRQSTHDARARAARLAITPGGGRRRGRSRIRLGARPPSVPGLYASSRTSRTRSPIESLASPKNINVLSA